MTDPIEPPDREMPQRPREYEDPHYHDEDESIPADDVNPWHGAAQPAWRRPPRRPPPRRHYPED